MEIKYLKHEEINRLKWDKCINQAVNGIVYAYSWYLDIVSYGWEALVFDDYKAVMPLTTKRKYGFNYIFQPRYTQQLGVFTSEILGQNLVESFLKAIPERYKIININLNTYNKVGTIKGQVKHGITYQLDLISSYKTIAKSYNQNTRRNIRKAEKNDIQISKHVNLKDLLLLKKQTSNIPITFEHLNILRRIIPFSVSHNLGETYGAYNKNNELVAAAYFIRSHNKSIYLLSASTNEGKEVGGMFLIIDKYIRENAEKNLTLDFEGSSIETLARFYKGFGANPINYNKVYMNRLPWFLKFIK